MEYAEAEPTDKDCIKGTRELTICQTTEKLDTWKLNEQQQQLVVASGLGNLVHTVGLVVDRAVLTAFFELWSKETNTAQFYGFEMAPSLRDTAYILGVPVTGRVVTTGAVLNKSVEELCFQYLGQVPDCRDCRGSHVKLSWLQSRFSRLSKRPSDDEIMYSARAYLMFLIGSALFPERDRGYVSPKYLPLLSNFEKVHEYAWGAAALAHLYKALSLAVVNNEEHRIRLFGSTALLMAWTYEYIPAMRPDMDDAPAHIFPRVRRWTGSKISQPTREASDITKAFGLLRVSDVDWEPYKGVDPASIPKHCVAPDQICFSRTWLISFNLKEIYVPDRYARQFGQEQHHPLNDVPAFQRHQWTPSVDWSLMYASEIERFQQLINDADGDPIHTAMPAAAADDVFTPATIARASLGLSLITVVEGVRPPPPRGPEDAEIASGDDDDDAVPPVLSDEQWEQEEEGWAERKRRRRRREGEETEGPRRGCELR
ncbi:LOW QUALITY PROTEIN: protein MAIN-LIKE 1-like [Oryza brachyantha]|uniref:LOW QUALITY PROTEIN: protein MAIN-LIKE 1-like n=1 Tax=Oryza brachyantha TaxID=4533 RepID=UPI001ADA1D15|nr:LOW QUALITY PROTEIN: protein MAIN-LIKE 1-like [Oryza brachyantha]